MRQLMQIVILAVILAVIAGTASPAAGPRCLEDEARVQLPGEPWRCIPADDIVIP